MEKPQDYLVSPTVFHKRVFVLSIQTGLYFPAGKGLYPLCHPAPTPETAIFSLDYAQIFPSLPHSNLSEHLLCLWFAVHK